MKLKLLVATATILTVAIAAPQGSIAFAQSTDTQTEQGKKTETDGMMKKESMAGQDDMMKKDGMKKKDGMSKKMGKDGGKAMMGKSGTMGKGGKGHKKGKYMMGRDHKGGKAMMGKRHPGGMGMKGKMRKKMMGKKFMVRAKSYTNADIKRIVDGRLARHGFSNLLAGGVQDGTKEITAVVDVVSPKGEFLFKVRVNRKTGMAAIIE